MGLSASIRKLFSRLVDHIETQCQFPEIIAVVSLRGEREKRGVGFVPTQSGAHGKQVANCYIGLLSFFELRQVIAYRVVETLDVPFFMGDTHEKADNAFCAGKKIGSQGVVPAVPIILVDDAVHVRLESGACTTCLSKSSRSSMSG